MRYYVYPDGGVYSSMQTSTAGYPCDDCFIVDFVEGTTQIEIETWIAERFLPRQAKNVLAEFVEYGVIAE